MKRVALWVAGTAALLLTVASPAAADFSGNKTDAGVRIKLLNYQAMKALQSDAAQSALPGAKPPFPTYASTSPCGGATPDHRLGDLTCGASAACAGNSPEQGLGPPVVVWEALVGKNGKPVDAQNEPVPTLRWTMLGTTCFPELVPGAQQALTMAQITAAFHDTRFALATVHIQPEGNLTLVTLPTYFELRWPTAGFQPDEVDSVDPARMSGYRVDIRPRLESIVYVFGDGAASQRTDSLGGPYPGGDIVHEYAKGGAYRVHADVTYGGQYRVNGGSWVDIPGSVTVPGTPETLQVRTAHARLVTH